jgi:rod shape-determining protein MreC
VETFLERWKNPLVLVVVLVAQFFLLAVQVRRPFPAATAAVDHAGVRALRYGVTSVVTPPESVVHKSGLSLRDVWSSYLDLVGVRQQNVELKQEVDQLRMEQAALAEDAREGERLQDLLAFRQHYVNTTVPAQVVGTSGTDRSRVLLLDKGSEDGIAEDMPVITPDGIVGRVREVYPRTSQVLEISDPTSASGVLLEETRTRGILRGSAQGRPEIVNLMPDDRIKPGQVVLTSGGDQIFPRGLPVGTVDRILPDPDNEPMVDVLLKPAANLGRIEEVLVVTSTAPAPTERARRDVARSQSVAAAAESAKEAAAKAAALAEAQRASDILAQRLPSRNDPSDPDAPDASPDASPATSEAEAKPLHPPSALHPDHYTPTDVPAAGSLTPGERYTPLAEGTPETERPAAKATSGNVPDASPVSTNPAFSSASAAMVAERKALADAKTAEAAKRYAALHPVLPVTAPAASSGAEAGTAAGVAASGARYVNRTNADGTVTRVAVPATSANAAGGAGAAASGVRYTTRVNADGTVTRVALPAATTPTGTATGTPAVRYTTRTNADGTVTRVPVPGAAGTSGSAPAVRYTLRTNADGTVTRVAVPATSATGAAPGVAPVRYTTRVNADGTVTRVPVPSTAGVNHPAGAARNSTGVHTTVVQDGPIAPAPHTAATPSTGTTASPAPKRKAPEIVPDDGSRPPQTATPPAAAPATPPQERP